MLVTPFFGEIFFCESLRSPDARPALQFNNGAIRSPKGHQTGVMEAIQEKFSSLFLPHRDLCIDESLMPWRGRLSFMQHMPPKRHRFGVKMFMVCDVKTGYVLRFLGYPGATVSLPKRKELGYGGSVVADLLADFPGKGHSPLVENACGTVRINRKGLPSFKKKMKKGEFHTDTLLALKWCDKRGVTTLIPDARLQ